MKPKVKNIIFLVLALAWPLVYKGLSKLWYFLMLDAGGIDLLPDPIRMNLLTNIFSLDAIFCVLMILVTLPLFFKIREADKENIPAGYVRKISGRGVIACLVIALGLAGAAAIYQIGIRTFMIDNAAVAESVQQFDQTFQDSTTLGSYIWSFLSIALFGPIVEELVFRGVLFSGLNRYLSGMWTVVITAVYFGLWHGNLMQVGYTALLGFGIGLAYAATRNMWFPMLIHLFNNIGSQLPPSLMDNESFALAFVILKFVAIIPMIVILYKMVKGNPAVAWKDSKALEESASS